MALSLTQPTGAVDPHDTSWFETAVFYEVMVRSFADSSGDGIGDLAGLTEHLDYLQWLGVDCLWLPPFFASPMTDGGYDVADYRAISPTWAHCPNSATSLTRPMIAASGSSLTS